MTEGDCDDGLECVFNVVIPDLPGTCMKPGKNAIYHHWYYLENIKNSNHNNDNVCTGYISSTFI